MKYLVKRRFAGVVSSLLVLISGIGVSQSANSSTYYFHNDHLGTPQVVTDEAQTVVWKGEYDPFGKVTETVGLIDQNLRFPGQYYDLETGLHYNYFRTYDPGTGRYVESDPIGLEGGLNTFGYVAQNPTKYTDYFGLEIYLQSHPVGLGLNHSKLTIFPRVGSKYYHYDKLTLDASTGRKYFTVGAGPDSRLIFAGPLQGGINREKDINLLINVSSESVIEGVCPTVEIEDEYITRILESLGRFDNNRFDYTLIATTNRDGFNSNSFINGLLRSVGLTIQSPPNAPGYYNPVPSNAFK